MNYQSTIQSHIEGVNILNVDTAKYERKTEYKIKCNVPCKQCHINHALTIPITRTDLTRDTITKQFMNALARKINQNLNALHKNADKILMIDYDHLTDNQKQFFNALNFYHAEPTQDLSELPLRERLLFIDYYITSKQLSHRDYRLKLFLTAFKVEELLTLARFLFKKNQSIIDTIKNLYEDLYLPDILHTLERLYINGKGYLTFDDDHKAEQRIWQAIGVYFQLTDFY